MKLKHFVWMAFALIVISSCKYDDDELWNRVNDHEARITALETWQKQANETIAGLQELINTMDYITAVTTLTEEGDTIGYRIDFKQSESITLYNGADAGISLTQGEDGNWYWTQNGELLLDSEGNPIRANGEDGASAPTPILKLGKDLPDDAVLTGADEGKKPENSIV